MQIRQTTQTRIHRSLIDTWVGFFNPEVPGFKNPKVLRVTTQKFFSFGALWEYLSSAWQGARLLKGAESKLQVL